jgi:hypothetical protein
VAGTNGTAAKADENISSGEPPAARLFCLSKPNAGQKAELRIAHRSLAVSNYE